MSIYNHGRRRRRRLTEHTVDAIIGLMVGMILAFVLYLLTLVFMSL
jgi:tetrahydromethanopterin S-methyltransferase subunit F